MNKDRCPSCDKLWINHHGIQGTCNDLQRAHSALRLIKTWAKYGGGSGTKAKWVADLCDKVLKEK